MLSVRSSSTGCSPVLPLATGLIVLFGVVTASSKENVLYAFRGGSDGSDPYSTLIADSVEDLYGTTAEGGGGTLCRNGANGCGTVFKRANDGTESVIYAFTGGSDGAYPRSGLVMDTERNLYGTASAGGTDDIDGTVFMVAHDGSETTRYAFQGGSDGWLPSGGLILDSMADIYGMTFFGGYYQGEDCADDGCGTVFELMPDNTKALLYAFKGGGDGAQPVGTLIFDDGGNLYGATALGGTNCANSNHGCGTVFKVALDGTETQLHAFQGGIDGALPDAGLLMDASGNLYGTTEGGGDGANCSLEGCGTVYKIDHNGTESVIYSFQGGAIDGWAPESSLIMDRAGNLYGTTYYGGSSKCHRTGCGTVFKIAPNGTETVLYAFGGSRNPAAGLLAGPHDRLYGTTTAGGTHKDGIVFSVKR